VPAKSVVLQLAMAGYRQEFLDLLAKTRTATTCASWLAIVTSRQLSEQEFSRRS
jgi:hypothetical protein